MEEREFKKQRGEGGADKREEWAQSKLNTPRENRYSSHGQKKREKRAMSTGANAAPHMRLDTVLGNLPDFRDEKPALVHLV